MSVTTILPGTPAYQNLADNIERNAYQNRNGIYYANNNNSIQHDSCSLTLQTIDAFIEEKGFSMSDPVSYKTLEKLQLESYGSTDCRYNMLPNDTIIKCYLINSEGEYINKDGSLGKVVTLARVSDKSVFYDDILYAVNIIGDNQDRWYQTRASDIIYPVQ